jgi:hypothetical protein
VGGSASWLIDDAHLYQVTNGMVRTRAALPTPGAPAAAYAASGGLVVAELVDGGVSVYQGQTEFSPVGSAELPAGLEFDNVSLVAHGATLVVAAQEQSSSNFSVATGLASSDRGKSWTTVDLPAFGNLSFAGDAFWLLGGPTGHQLWHSDDGRAWTSADVTASERAEVSAPVDIGGAAYLAVAVGGHTSATIERWQGGAWSPVATSPVTAETVWTVSPSGHLLAGPDGSFAVAAGPGGAAIALVSESTCPDGKPSCTETVHAETSDDNGKTWTRPR